MAAQGMSDLAQSLPWGRDESELVTELQSGSDAAFDWLVTYYHAGVYNLVYGILSDSADAADVTQEVFLRAFRGIRGFRRGSSLKTWLYRISVRQALNHRRWCWRHHRQQISIDAEDEASNPALDLKDGEASPFEQLEAREMQATVRASSGASAGVVSQRGYSKGPRGPVVRRGGRSAGSFRRNRQVPNPARAPHAEGNSRSAFARSPSRIFQ